MLAFDADIEPCVRALSEGGLILYPTDTVWGIGCDATNEEAVSRIYRLKHRPDSKSLIVLVADERDVLRFVSAPDLAVFDHLSITTKPTTVVYDGVIGLAGNLLAADGSAGIRICHDEFCMHLIKRFRKPIVSTSANISGMPTARNFRDITAAIKDGVDYVVRYRQDDESAVSPSSVIRWHNGKVEVLRP